MFPNYLDEKGMEDFLFSLGYDEIYDSEGCIDSTIVIDYAVEMGYTPILNEVTQTYVFKLDKR